MGAAVCRDWKTPTHENFMLSRSPTPIPTPHSRAVVFYILSPRPPRLATLYFQQAHRDFNSPCISKLLKQMLPKVISVFNVRNTNSNSKFILQKNSSHSRSMFLKQTKFSSTSFSTKAEFRWFVYLLHIPVSEFKSLYGTSYNKWSCFWICPFLLDKSLWQHLKLVFG
jgi:hypothetical protein